MATVLDLGGQVAEALPDGARVRVDGSTGDVVLLGE